MPILQQSEIVGHAVRAAYLYSGVTDVAMLTSDSSYLAALSRIWQNMVSCKLYITGGIGSRCIGEGFGPDYELNNMTAYCETCASIANVYWNYRMFLATGDSKYMDVCERSLYNGVLSGVSLSGDRFFYDNPLESNGQHERQPWFGCACCPGNITRFMASVPQYMYATRGSDIYINLFIQSEAVITTVSGKVTVSQTTRYPWDGDVVLDVSPEKSAFFTLRLRLPGWSQYSPLPGGLYSFLDSPRKYSVTVNGRNVTCSVERGYLCVTRLWSPGDKVRLSLPMDVRRIKASDMVEDDRGKVAFQRGPLIYCLEGADQSDSIVFNKYIGNNVSVHTEYLVDKLGGIVELSGQAIQVGRDGRPRQTVFRAVPYCTWNNRGKGQMEVWIPQSYEKVSKIPVPTIASLAETPDCYGVNDQYTPHCSSDISKPYHYWWYTAGPTVTAQYKFDRAYEVDNAEIYWLDFDHYECDFRVPESWKLQYLTADGKWSDVRSPSPYGVSKDIYNKVTFNPVTTRGLRVVVCLQSGKSGGIHEWKVGGR